MNPLNYPSLASALRFFKRMKRNESGLITVEAVIILPVLFWSLTASYTFFDSYRQSARNLKAAYAISDVVSRELGIIDAGYVDTLYELMKNMVADRSDMDMRVSFLLYDKDNDNEGTKRHTVLWSCVRGNKYEKWNKDAILDFKEAIPAMPNHGRLVLVETSNTYRAPYKIGFSRSEYPMNNFVYTHPRIFDNIRADDVNC